jgi:DNA-directed RNA polymerase subunit RPC12/RpoP
MSKVNRDRLRHAVGGHSIKINGKILNIHFARIAYRCEECLGELELHNAGIRCKAQCGGRGFITKAEAEAIKQNQTQNIETLKEFYQIIDGKVVIK